MTAAYIGRFAPSPTGPLHAGSLVCALASWLDARAHHGQWLVRIEDIDRPRCVGDTEQTILRQLADCGLQSDQPPVWQSQRSALYQRSLDALVSRGLAYPCACSRKDIASVLQSSGQSRSRHAELIYPGTCRNGLQGKTAQAWRFRCEEVVRWSDRRLGPQQQDVVQAVGDFVLKRSDGLWAYQLAVVVDDAEQGISHVVRGEDLADNTARQVLLQRALGLASPSYLHSPLVHGADGEKLSKQNGAQALDTRAPLPVLNAAAQVLGLRVQASNLSDWLSQATALWGERWPLTL